jgi:DNA-binding response OmpR family regulator
MPGERDGIDLAHWVRRERPGVKVILTSGVARAAREADHLCAEASLIAKPYDQEDLQLRIHELLGRQISS